MSVEGSQGPDLEREVRAVGARLTATLGVVVDACDGVELGPQRLSEALKLDKVLVSRVLKALRKEDAVDQLHHMPGPAPLRRFLRAAKRHFEVTPDDSRDVSTAIGAFETLLNDRVGDRSALTSLLTAWSTDVRAEFELRRKQAAWRALSELVGSTVELSVSTVVLSPAKREGHLDVTWVFGLIGLQRLRPGVEITVTTRRTAQEDTLRHPEDLDGHPLEDTVGDRLDAFCERETVHMDVARLGETQHYTLAGDAYGPKTALDLLFAEVNRAEMASHVPKGSGRRGWVSKDNPIPARRFVFDVLVHGDVYPGEDPELLLFAPGTGDELDVNDRASEHQRLDLLESVERIEPTADGLALRGFPRYAEAVGHVLEKLDCDADAMRAYRVAIEYPLLGMQAALAFRAPETE